MESIKERIKIVQSKIDASKTDKNVKLVAVSKKKSWQEISEAVSYTHLRAHETR